MSGTITNPPPTTGPAPPVTNASCCTKQGVSSDKGEEGSNNSSAGRSNVALNILAGRPAPPPWAPAGAQSPQCHRLWEPRITAPLFDAHSSVCGRPCPPSPLPPQVRGRSRCGSARNPAVTRWSLGWVGGNLKAWPVCSCCIWRKASFCWNWFTSVTLCACAPTCTSPSYTEFQAG